jgi:hypothetical protein
MVTNREPVTVALQLLAAENAHDVQTAVSLFDDHAVVKPAMYTYTTRAEIRAWQEELAAGSLVIRAGKLQAVGSTVHWDGQIALDRFRQLGFESLDGSWEVVVEGGKIISFTFKLSPSSLARLQAVGSR